MYALKTVSLAFLLLVANVQAGRITYTCYNKTGGIKKDGILEQKAGGTIPDDQVDVVVTGMHTWSGGKYTAAVNTKSNVLIVKCVNKAANKNLATAANNEQQQLVNSHITRAKRDAGIDHVDVNDEDDDEDVEYAF
ncbi:hypothetical protein SBOR_5941 [Sclerotinia borealis F-4128]|uniref:Uncharacterized protein n=1 Tax=Sclerotinia borealis (strain F-4128) TaxID=1432307 RepID=W9CGJ3_SCLBF|nr:hypothetical protein SBOR_5941 [Sclerotinia borealis F-4128]